MSEYIKIADFASKTGISKEEAYKIANDPRNKDYVILEDGIKKISSFLLDDTPREKKESQPEPKKQEQSQPADAKEIEYLKEQIRELQAQIKKKDELYWDSLTKKYTRVLFLKISIRRILKGKRNNIVAILEELLPLCERLK